MTASEHNTGSDSLEHRINPPKNGTRLPPDNHPCGIRYVICPASPRAPSGLIYSTRKRSSAAENSPIRNKLVGRQLTGENPHRSPPRCVGTSDCYIPANLFGPQLPA